MVHKDKAEQLVRHFYAFLGKTMTDNVLAKRIDESYFAGHVIKSGFGYGLCSMVAKVVEPDDAPGSTAIYEKERWLIVADRLETATFTKDDDWVLHTYREIVGMVAELKDYLAGEGTDFSDLDSPPDETGDVAVEVDEELIDAEATMREASGVVI